MQGLGERIGKDMLLICLERRVFGKLGGCMSDADVLRVWESFWAFESFFFQARPGLTVSGGALLLLFSHLRFHDCLGSLSQVQGSIVDDLPTIYYSPNIMCFE